MFSSNLRVFTLAVILTILYISPYGTCQDNSTSVSQMNCIPVLNWVYFDVTGLKNTTHDYVSKLDATRTINWNICQYTVTKCGDKNSYANLYPTGSACSHLTSDTSYRAIYTSLIDPNLPETGIQFVIGGGDVSPTTKMPYNFTLVITCDKTVPTYQEESVTFTDPMAIIKIRSTYGCPKLNPSAIWSFIASNQWLFTLCSLAMGIVLCFFAYRIINITIFMLGFCISFVPIMYIFFAFFISDDTASGWKWFCLIISLAAGGGVGYACVRMQKIGYFAIGFCLAYVAASALWVPILSRFDFSYPTFMFFLLWVAMGVPMGFMVSRFPNFWIIITSSVYGAYLIVKPMLALIFDMPNEFEVARQIAIGELQSLPAIMYVYIVLLALFAGAGLYFQFKKKGELEAEPEPNYYYEIGANDPKLA